jgi:hypothetical protein
MDDPLARIGGLQRGNINDGDVSETSTIDVINAVVPAVLEKGVPSVVPAVVPGVVPPIANMPNNMPSSEGGDSASSKGRRSRSRPVSPKKTQGRPSFFETGRETMQPFFFGNHGNLAVPNHANLAHKLTHFPKNSSLDLNCAAYALGNNNFNTFNTRHPTIFNSSNNFIEGRHQGMQGGNNYDEPNSADSNNQNDVVDASMQQRVQEFESLPKFLHIDPNLQTYRPILILCLEPYENLKIPGDVEEGGPGLAAMAKQIVQGILGKLGVGKAGKDGKGDGKGKEGGKGKSNAKEDKKKRSSSGPDPKDPKAVSKANKLILYKLIIASLIRKSKSLNLYFFDALSVTDERMYRRICLAEHDLPAQHDLREDLKRLELRVVY